MYCDVKRLYGILNDFISHKIVCSACITRSFALPEVDVAAPVRVCDECGEELELAGCTSY